MLIRPWPTTLIEILSKLILNSKVMIESSKDLDVNHKSNFQALTLPMLWLPSSTAQACKDFRKLSKPCHVGIHWIALTEYSQMSTHLPGFQKSFRFFASFCIGQISHQQHKCLWVEGLWIKKITCHNIIHYNRKLSGAYRGFVQHRFSVSIPAAAAAAPLPAATACSVPPWRSPW